MTLVPPGATDMREGDFKHNRRLAKRRGAPLAPRNRFERVSYWNEPEYLEEAPDRSAVRTIFLPDRTQSIISENDSPDVGFRFSVNPYRGCEHGCPYCYARPTHETLGMNAGIDFETRILVKERAPDLLRATLASARWRAEPIAFSGVTDCYQPIERKLQLTRRCLEVCAEFRQPVVIVTKNRLVVRDKDILGPMARQNLARVVISITTLDPSLARALEPRASLPRHRLDAIRELTETGIPVGVLVAPVIPALNDSEIPSILEAAREAGAVSANWVLLRLPGAVRETFADWLERVVPGRKDAILNRIRACRNGRLNDTEFGRRMRGEGPLAEAIGRCFEVTARRLGLAKRLPPLDSTQFRRPGGFRQRSLFE